MHPIFVVNLHCLGFLRKLAIFTLARSFPQISQNTVGYFKYVPSEFARRLRQDFLQTSKWWQEQPNLHVTTG